MRLIRKLLYFLGTVGIGACFLSRMLRILG